MKFERIAKVLRALCAKTSPQRVIIASASLEQETMQTFFDVMETSKPSRKLSENENQAMGEALAREQVGANR